MENAKGHREEPRLPVFAIERHRLTTDGVGVSTLIGAYGCPLQCKYCLNPHAWNPKTLQGCTYMSVSELYERVKIDHLYFLATGGGVTFGGGEALLHAEFLEAFRACCGKDWRLTVETSLNVSQEKVLKALQVIDDFIVDIKDMNPDTYEAYTGKSIHKVLENLRWLADVRKEKHIRIRVPRIPEYNNDEDVRVSVEMLRQMGFEEIEVFTYVVEKGQLYGRVGERQL